MNQSNRSTKIIPLFIAVILFTLSALIANGAPTVDVTPSQPKPLGTVTFTATITDADNIEKVTIRVQECGNEPDIGYICYTDEFNETMTQISGDTYTASVTLSHENAIEIKYQLKYLTDQGWSSYPTDDLITVDLDTSGQSNGNSNGDNDNSGSDTPGFEVIGLFISVIFISLILYRHKRKHV